eukprot:8519643-Prorocentrum_lima.AAC.1
MAHSSTCTLTVIHFEARTQTASGNQPDHSMYFIRPVIKGFRYLTKCAVVCFVVDIIHACKAVEP